MTRPEDTADLGHGVTATLMWEGDDEHGYRVTHVMHDHPAAHSEGFPYPNGIMPDGQCAGAMALEGRVTDAHATWSVAAGDPDTTGLTGLTLTPSSLCMSCGHHGFITNGAWVPA